MKIKNRPSFTAPVHLDGLDEPILFRFRRLSLTARMAHLDTLRDKLSALESPAEPAPSNPPAPAAKPDIPSAEIVRKTLEIKTDFLLAFIEGWEGVEDAEFSRDELLALLDDFDDAYDKIAAAFREGGAAAALGNLSPSPASGPAAAAA